MGEEARSDESGTLDRIHSRLKRSPAGSLLVLVAAVIGATTTVIGTGIGIDRWYDDRYRADDRTEDMLESLRANVVVEEFDDKLGRPRISTPEESGESTQHIYGGDGYWVQAVADTNGVVVRFAVTVCDPDLHPTWDLPGRNVDEQPLRLVLRNTAVGEFGTEASGWQWSIFTATANKFVYATYGGGNPTNYQTYSWGWNDACLDRELDDLIDGTDDIQPTGTTEGTLSTDFQRVLTALPANTFGIHGIDLAETDTSDFQIGADRIMVRTLVEP